jgi:hypothetical protein
MDKDGIIAMSPTVPSDAQTLAHRIVIRDLGDSFVVHMQIFEGDRHYFESGNYFPKRSSAPTVAESDRRALREAYEKFDERSRRILAMPEPPARQLQQVSDIAESIINAILPDDIEDRADLIEDDYQLESDIETFENLTGKSLWERTTPDDLGDPEVEDIDRSL